VAVRTVETVECQERILLIEGPHAKAFEACPLCGAKLGSPADDPLHPHLLEKNSAGR